MRTYNRATVIGNVGSEVILRYTQTGKAVANLSVATHERRKDGPEVTTWHRVVLWERLAELTQQYVKKGQTIYVEGPLSHREWVDSNGIVRNRSEITAREVLFLGEPATRSQQGPSNEDTKPVDAVPGSNGEETSEVSVAIPF
ncbi:MAG TPA: single-stranded DNA-binding protein [Deltaproteobacteria bacterium]|nr:single-stranded DNA-binding protein [Deltaproteobacteria bacterium]HCP47000.1 single-stranded DNA-binding protein [Deltaproteobacteria bacterium]